MDWQRRYQLRNQVEASLWIVPVLAGFAAVLCHRLVWAFDLWTRWRLFHYSLDGARSIVGAISASMLTFIVFLMSMILIALQVAVGQLTPRIIAFAFSNPKVKWTLAMFTFTYMFSFSAQGRIDDPVPQLVVLTTLLLTLASTGVFLYFIDFMGKSMRPVSICEKLGGHCFAAIEEMYPAALADRAGTAPPADPGAAARTITHPGPAGVILSFDAQGLVELAARQDCLIQVVPQVGDFLPSGEPLFRILRGGAGLDAAELRRKVALGPERTIHQDVGFVLRIMVDIAIKALSPAINDPTTAIACLDHLQMLLRRLGERDLGEGRLKDREGNVRVLYAAPSWEDYLRLAVCEIRQCGGNSIQVVRRLRVLLDTLLEQLPELRAGELRAQLDLLDAAVARNFPDAGDRDLGLAGDYKGIGGRRLA